MRVKILLGIGLQNQRFSVFPNHEANIDWASNFSQSIHKHMDSVCFQVQSRFFLTRNKNLFLRILGIVIADVVLFFCVVAVVSMLESFVL